MDHWYAPVGNDRYLATATTAGPWDPGAQHGGPPAALLARALEATAPRPEMMFARLAYEILGPVPVAEVTVRSAVTRPGRSVELLTAVLAAGGRDVMSVHAWRILRTDDATALAAGQAAADAGQPTPPKPPPPTERRDRNATSGYLSSVDWSGVHGAFGEPGPAACWTRLRGEVVAGERPSALQRVVAAADSGNGMSGLLPMATHWFINPELTVHLHREARGEWVLLDAMTSVDAGGVGLATSVLSDLDGPVARGAQSLLVAPR